MLNIAGAFAIELYLPAGLTLEGLLSQGTHILRLWVFPSSVIVIICRSSASCSSAFFQ
jgi:hypothetical protein